MPEHALLGATYYNLLEGTVVLASATLAVVHYVESRLQALVAERRGWALSDLVANAVHDMDASFRILWHGIVQFEPHEAKASTYFMLAILSFSAVLYALASVHDFWLSLLVIAFVLQAAAPLLAIMLALGIYFAGHDLLKMHQDRTHLSKLAQDLTLRVHPAA